jgi:uncharacterized protein YjiS (DUF1127 family)
MTAVAISNRPEVTPFTFVQDTLKGLRRSRARAAQQKLLLSFDDYLLRDMGVTRLDVLNGDF